MASILTGFVRAKVGQLCGNDFQEFVVELYLLRYGTNFHPIKPKRDKGCDGILKEEGCVLAVYGPEKRDLPKFRRKAREDYTEYQLHWQAQYPLWRFIYNDELTAEEHRVLTDLDPQVQPVGIPHIIHEYESLTWSEKRRLASYLGIDLRLFHNDILSEILNDLIADAKPALGAPYGKPTYIEDKIKLNYSESDVASATDQYRECLQYFPTLRILLAGYQDRDLSALRSRIRRDYDALGGPFTNRFRALTARYSEASPQDDTYWFFVEVVLVYFFEVCLIGDKTEDENR